MSKIKLATGMFGVDNEGEIFVVVGDKLMYENGQYDEVAELNDHLEFPNHHIVELHEATCFKMVKEGRSRVIWKRPEPEKEAPKTEECKVTITEDEFFEIVKEANELWMNVSKDVPGGELANVVMGLQNVTFGSVIASVLFGKEIN